jgi:predicted nucleic acid-binding protein
MCRAQPLTAQQAGAEVLYTEDLQHNQLVGGTLRVVNPFLMVANEPL